MKRWAQYYGRMGAAAALLAAAMASPALAVPIQLEVAGTVTFASPVLAGTFVPGQSMTATLRYESSAASTTSLIPTRKTYPAALLSGSFSIDAYAGTLGGGAINVADDDPTLGDRLRFDSGGIAAATVATRNPFLFRVQLGDAGETALNVLDLPLTLPALSEFTERFWMLAFTPIALMDVDQTRVEGRVLSATLTSVAVPVPSVPALLGLGSAMALLFTRRKLRCGGRLAA